MYFHFSKKESIAREMLGRWSDAVTATVGKVIATGQPADRQVLIIYRELARRTQNEAIIRAGLILSVDKSLTTARATYEAWTAAIEPIVSTRVVPAPSTPPGRALPILSAPVSSALCRLPPVSTRTTPSAGGSMIYC